MSFCVKCGAEGPVFDSVCEACFLEGKRFSRIADHVNLLQCVHCKEYAIDNKWIIHETIEGAAEEIAIDSVEVVKDAKVEEITASVLAADQANYRVHIDITMNVKGLIVEEELDTIVRLKNSVCGRCSKIKGSYFESIIQIRSRERKLKEKEVDDVLDRIDRMVCEASADNRDIFVTKVDRMVGGAGGADVYLSSNSFGKIISRDLADQYGAEVKDTAKLLTQKEGRDVYRVTYLVRLPAYRFGDVIMFRKKMYLVGPMRTSGSRLTDMKTGETINYSHIDLTDAKVIGQREDMKDAIVLMDSNREVQILHPVSMKPIELRKPNKFEVKGETVKVFLHEDEIYLIPK
ncbi:MAG: NMD3 family protein [Methanomassiliicoccales archaeon PtaU1.Bin124]|nr:MAG: NMD3 family protein [Methanomassiliicoccales archaeon PtaU1.Bin124]